MQKSVLGLMMVLGAWLGGFGAAKADFQVRLYEDGTLVQTLRSGGGSAISYSGTSGDFSVSLTYQSRLTAGAMYVTNNDRMNTHTFTMTASAQDFASAPSGGIATGTVLSGSVYGHFATYVDPGNALFARTFSSGGLNFATTRAGQDFAGSQARFGSNSPGRFSMSTSVGFGISPLGGLNFIQTDGLASTSMPGPPGLALVLAGLPLAGAYGWRCRRRLA